MELSCSLATHHNSLPAAPNKHLTSSAYRAPLTVFLGQRFRTHVRDAGFSVFQALNDDFHCSSVIAHRRL